MSAARNAQQFVAQLFAVAQEEEDDDHDQERRRHTFNRRRDFFVTLPERLALRDDAHFHVGALEPVAGGRDALEHAFDHGERAAALPLQEVELLVDVLARRGRGDLHRHGVELLIDPPATHAEHGRRQAEGKDDRAGAAEERPLQAEDDRREQKREQHRQRHRHHDRFGQMQNGDDDDRAEEDARIRLPPVRGPFVRHLLRLRTRRHPPHRQRFIEPVGIVVVESGHAWGSLMQRQRRGRGIAVRLLSC